MQTRLTYYSENSESTIPGIMYSEVLFCPRSLKMQDAISNTSKLQRYKSLVHVMWSFIYVNTTHIFIIWQIKNIHL